MAFPLVRIALLVAVFQQRLLLLSLFYKRKISEAHDEKFCQYVLFSLWKSIPAPTELKWTAFMMYAHLTWLINLGGWPWLYICYCSRNVPFSDNRLKTAM